MKTIQAKPINSTNAIGKKRKKPKGLHKKDDENILSKDIDVEEEMKVLERMGERKIMKPREELAQSTFTLKNLKFRPQKYKGNYLPYHLRWIFSNNVKSNEIVLLHEIEGLENEISRLKKMKMLNRECRKIAKLPFGISTNLCQCCHKMERKKHECTHLFCGPGCPRKKAEEIMINLLNNAKQNNKDQINPLNNSMMNQANPLKPNEFLQGGDKNMNLTQGLAGTLTNMATPSNPTQGKMFLGHKKLFAGKLFGTVDRSKEKKSIFVVKSEPPPSTTNNTS